MNMIYFICGILFYAIVLPLLEMMVENVKSIYEVKLSKRAVINQECQCKINTIYEQLNNGEKTPAIGFQYEPAEEECDYEEE